MQSTTFFNKITLSAELLFISPEIGVILYKRGQIYGKHLLPQRAELDSLMEQAQIEGKIVT